MRVILLGLVVSAACAAMGDVAVETDTFRLVVGDDAAAKSLVVKATGEECVDAREGVPLFTSTQERPFNNETKLAHPHKRTTYRANRVRREGDMLVVGFAVAPYEALVRVRERGGYALFTLEGFRTNTTDEKQYGGLTMDVPPVASFRLLQLPVRSRANFGDWLNVSWDDRAAVAVVGADPYSEIDHEDRFGFRLLNADLRRGLKLRGGSAALVAGAGREPFLAAVDEMEKDLGLPKGVESRRNPLLNASIYWTHDICPTNVDEHVAWAKKGGFRMMLVYFTAVCSNEWSYAHLGNYDWPPTYPNGEKDLRTVLDRIKAAGIMPGFHTLQTHIGLKSRYVTPDADPRLNKTMRFTLAGPLPDDSSPCEVEVLENTSEAVRCAPCRILQFGGELMSYEGFTESPPYRFTGVRRGHCGTRVRAHLRGEVGGVLDVSEFAAASCYIDQRTDLQNEVAEKIAKIYDAGMGFCYFDGSEGVNPPCGVNVALSQWRTVKAFKKPPLFTEGAAKSHFGWHLQAGANAFDIFPPEKFKEKIVEYPLAEAPVMRQDFTRLDFGWWGFWTNGEEVGGRKTIGTQPDMWEYGTSKAAAWDCPATIQADMAKFMAHPRADDIMETMRRWEDVRARNLMTDDWREKLKDPKREFHLLDNGRGGYDLVEWRHIQTESAPGLRAFMFERNGRRVVAYWHISGSGRYVLSDSAATVIDAAGMKYFESDISAAEAISAFAGAVPAQEPNESAGDPARWVDPFVGTSATGHTFPAACVPFGLVQAGPDTGNNSWHYCSGYRFEDGTIRGFSQTHLNGTGNAELGDLRMLPFRGEKPMPSAFDHSEEHAEPGFYSVVLKDSAVTAEIAAAEHSAIYRIAGEGRLRLLVDCEHGLTEDAHDPSEEIVEGDAHLDGSTGLSGTNRRRHWVDRRWSFVVRFNKPFAKSERVGKSRKYVLDFDLGDGEPLLVKVAISAEGGVVAAKRNLEAEISGWSFDAVKASAREKWNALLGRAEVEGTDDQKRNFYTSLYHLFIQPSNIADAGEKPFYSTLSTWDTFRAAHPLYTILAPEKADEFVDSMLEQGRRTGYLPIWTLWGKENQGMIGTHSVPVIVDWFLKELFTNGNCHNCSQITNTNSTCSTRLKSDRLQYWLAAYAQIKDTLTKPHEGRTKEQWDLLDKYGYYPFDKVERESVSRTMECAYDDWCAGVMAKRLGELLDGWREKLELESGQGGLQFIATAESLKADAEFFFKRSENWRNVFDPSMGLVRGKDSKGEWRTPFNPYRIGHLAGEPNDFTEGNAFQYTWHVMQDPDGLIAAMGGRVAFVERLDSLFSAPSVGKDQGGCPDVTGLIGQYVHGNEPSHHVIYFYTLAGHPEKAAERIREVFDKFYLPKPDGLCGNDDCGQMSAWYLFSAMGFYPFNPCGGEYVIGAPQVERVTLSTRSTCSTRLNAFTILTKNLSKENRYVKSVTLNGKPLVGRGDPTAPILCHADIMRGGELAFEMADHDK